MSKLVYKINKPEFMVKVRAGQLVCQANGVWVEEDAVVAEIVVFDGRTVKDYEHLTSHIPCFTGNARKIKRVARKIAKHYATQTPLAEQKELQREVIMAATHYAFESDGSVALSGPLGSLWVFKDGSVHPVGTPDSSHGYPGYSEPAGLRVAKSDALGHLGLTTVVEKFGRQAELHCEEVGNGTDYPDYRDVFYFPKEDETYNAGYRSGGTWTDGWWS